MASSHDGLRPEAGLHAGFRDWLLPATDRDGPLQRAALHYTYDGQSALFQAFAALGAKRRGRVLVPAYHCPTVVEPILRAGHEIDFYDITADLRHAGAPLSERITEQHVAVLVINYFGFEFDLSGIFSVSQAVRPLLIEDCCHSFLHASGRELSGARGDVAIYSFKKLAPCHTGGAIRYNRNDVPRPPAAAQAAWAMQFDHGRQVLRDSVRYSSCDFISRLSPPAPFVPLEGPVSLPALEDIYPFPGAKANCTMPPLARRILAHTDLVECAQRRRANYRLVAERLRGLPAVEQPFAELDDCACPWGYPILLEERASTDYKLKNLGVPFFSFGEQLHPAIRPQLAHFPVAADLSRRLVFLSIHQQLTTAQIETYCSALVKFFGGTPP